MAALEQLVGTVSKINGKGFQVQERPGTWLNISQYADPQPELPQAGQRVRLGLDTKGFVREITVVDGSTPASSAPSPSTAASSRGAGPREASIVRLSCLKTAASFLATRPEAKSTDVLALAQRFEEWVGRPS